MPSAFDKGSDQAKKGKTIKSPYDSETFDADVTIHVAGLVGSATIAPSGRDIALAS
jgi:WD repeat-containing protein 59